MEIHELTEYISTGYFFASACYSIFLSTLLIFIGSLSSARGEISPIPDYAKSGIGENTAADVNPAQFCRVSPTFPKFRNDNKNSECPRSAQIKNEKVTALRSYENMKLSSLSLFQMAFSRPETRELFLKLIENSKNLRRAFGTLIIPFKLWEILKFWGFVKVVRSGRSRKAPIWNFPT